MHEYRDSARSFSRDDVANGSITSNRDFELLVNLYLTCYLAYIPACLRAAREKRNEIARSLT